MRRAAWAAALDRAARILGALAFSFFFLYLAAQIARAWFGIDIVAGTVAALAFSVGAVLLAEPFLNRRYHR